MLPVLEQWLRVLVIYQALDKSTRKGAGYLANYGRRSVLDVDTAWKTILRNRGLAKWDLGGFMGHDVSGSTETYAIGRFDTVYRTLDDILGKSRGSRLARCAELSLSGIFPRKVKMPDRANSMVGVARIELATPAMSTQCEHHIAT